MKDSDFKKVDNFYDAANLQFCTLTCPCRAGIVYIKFHIFADPKLWTNDEDSDGKDSDDKIMPIDINDFV